MSEGSPKPSEEGGLRTQPESGLADLSKVEFPALSEIINRSLVHIQTSKSKDRPTGTVGNVFAKGLVAGQELEFEIALGVKIIMRWIPPGDFSMGTPEGQVDETLTKVLSDNEFVHHVKITKGFWLAQTAITQSQWYAVMGSNPSRFKGENLPVENVSWNDICGDDTRSGGFLGKINKMVSHEGCFDLPTEAQWEYACRAGVENSDFLNLDALGWAEISWLFGNSGSKTNAVGQKKPNPWGLHDMLGNVWEWCADWYGEYTGESEVDPTGPIAGTYKVFRGAGWANPAGWNYATSHVCGLPGDKHGSLGFRVALYDFSRSGD